MGVPVDKVDLMSVFFLVTFLNFHANSNFLQFNSLDFIIAVFLTINISEKKFLLHNLEDYIH